MKKSRGEAALNYMLRCVNLIHVQLTYSNFSLNYSSIIIIVFFIFFVNTNINSFINIFNYKLKNQDQH